LVVSIVLGFGVGVDGISLMDSLSASSAVEAEDNLSRAPLGCGISKLYSNKKNGNFEMIDRLSDT
jgi:hypothetical protein